jgi:serine/threonine protein kinase/peptidoglycan hydrolase-like protein with peptidoglycan-binding domain
MSHVPDQASIRGSEVDFVALRVGQMIGRYEIVAILGQGGFGITYRAKDAQLNREVAIKEYLPSALAIRQDGVTVLPRSTRMADDFAWGRQRFVDEGRTLATLQRAPAIVRVFDFLEANGTAYIVMELVPGETLEHRLARIGTLPPDAVDRIVWPLLEGLERVHAAGFLHRDIKPANILLDSGGNPTLIDFGASRLALAGKTSAMTAVFTPGYAAAEQFTSGKQGPWTDIYGLAATLHHAITGAPPPNAVERMLDDAYEPLARRIPAGFSPGLLAGIDAGLAVRATDRPQTIEGWRAILDRATPPDAMATVVMTRPAAAPTNVATPAPSGGARRGGKAPWIAAAVLAILVLAGAGYYLADRPFAPDPAVIEAAHRQQEAAAAEAAKQKARDEELGRLKAEAATRKRAEREAAQRREIEEELRAKLAAEQAQHQRAEQEARQQAEVAEGALRLGQVDRQHVQVALTALGFRTNTTNGVLGSQTREMIAAWQKAHNFPPTGFLTGAQNQALVAEAGPAVAKFDDDRKKAEEAASRAATPPPAPGPAAHAAAASPASVADGLWRGTYHCTPSRGAGEFTINLQINVSGGSGTWHRPGSGPGTTGNQSITLQITGTQVLVQRVFTRLNQAGAFSTATMVAQLQNGTITGSGPEANSGGRTCQIMLAR